MSATQQFLVTFEGYEPDGRSPEMDATALRYSIASLPSTHFASEYVDVAVAPLPDLATDDTDLQVGFRGLASIMRLEPGLHALTISRAQAAALVAELSKQHPARTSHVAHAALDAVRAIREADQQPGQQAQKNARAQLIITDAICRCVPEDKA